MPSVSATPRLAGEHSKCGGVFGHVQSCGPRSQGLRRPTVTLRRSGPSASSALRETFLEP